MGITLVRSSPSLEKPAQGGEGCYLVSHTVLEQAAAGDRSIPVSMRVTIPAVREKNNTHQDPPPIQAKEQPLRPNSLYKTDGFYLTTAKGLTSSATHPPTTPPPPVEHRRCAARNTPKNTNITKTFIYTSSAVVCVCCGSFPASHKARKFPDKLPRNFRRVANQKNRAARQPIRKKPCTLHLAPSTI